MHEPFHPMAGKARFSHGTLNVSTHSGYLSQSSTIGLTVMVAAVPVVMPKPAETTHAAPIFLIEALCSKLNFRSRFIKIERTTGINPNSRYNQ